MLSAILMAACSDYVDVEQVSPTPVAGNQGAYFPTTNTTTFELEPTEPTEVSITISRTGTDAATVPVIVETNQDNVFNVPQTVSFGSGEKEATMKVTFPNAAEGTTYTLKLALDGEQYVNPYGEEMPYMTFNVTRIKWTPVEDPMIYVDGLFPAAGWSTAVSRPMYVYAEKAQLGSSVRYRFKNVYKPATSSTPDEDGVYSGFHDNSPGFDSSQDWVTTIEIHSAAGTSGNVSMFTHPIGVEWDTYGEISIGSAADKFGTLASNVITFPAGALLFHDADGSYNGGATTIYVTKEAYIAANMVITDFNDVEYEVVEGELGEYQSAAYTETWNKTIAKAIDIDSLNDASEYNDLYYISDLYANNYGLAFYYDDESGKVTIPSDQRIGTSVFGSNLYVSPSDDIESTVHETFKGVTVYTFGLTFHYSDGTVVGEFAEKFYYMEDALVYDKSDFLNNFVLRGPSLLGGAAANMESVKIAEGASADSFVITGIRHAKEVGATFDATTNVMSIAPQALADIVVNDTTVYDATLLTYTGKISDAATIDLAFNTAGVLEITDDSEAFGYVIDSETADAYLSGYHSFTLTPVFETAEVAPTSAQSNSTFSLRSSRGQNIQVDRIAEGAGHNFSVQGKKLVKEFKREMPTSRVY